MMKVILRKRKSNSDPPLLNNTVRQYAKACTSMGNQNFKKYTLLLVIFHLITDLQQPYITTDVKDVFFSLAKTSLKLFFFYSLFFRLQQYGAQRSSNVTSDAFVTKGRKKQQNAAKSFFKKK